MKKIVLVLTIALAFISFESKARVDFSGDAKNVYIGLWHASWECAYSQNVCFTWDNANHTVTIYTCKGSCPVVINPVAEPTLEGSLWSTNFTD